MSQDNSPDEVRERRSAAGNARANMDAKGPSGRSPNHLKPAADHNKAVGNEPVYPPGPLQPSRNTTRKRRKNLIDQRAGIIQEPPGPKA